MFFTSNDFNELLSAQETLNIKYSGQDWYLTKHPVHFLTAIFTETAEFFESAPRVGVSETNGWKFWKPYMENDTQNMRVEIVDVLHFVMSIILILQHKSDIVIDEDLIDQSLGELKERSKSFDSDSFILFHNYYGLLSVGVTHLDKFYDYEYCEHVARIAIGFLAVSFQQINANPGDIHNWYFLKNELNSKRIDGGYMRGEYEKYSEDGTEDNRALDLT